MVQRKRNFKFTDFHDKLGVDYVDFWKYGFTNPQTKRFNKRGYGYRLERQLTDEELSLLRRYGNVQLMNGYQSFNPSNKYTVVVLLDK